MRAWKQCPKLTCVSLQYILPGKGVCRSLFSRSQSVSFEMGSKQKKEGDEAGKQASKRKRGWAVSMAFPLLYNLYDVSYTKVEMAAPIFPVVALIVTDSLAYLM